jgi:hypothetical protein
MKEFFLLAGLAIIIITSCKKKDDQKDVPYLGKWDLVYFTKNNQPEVYIPGDIVWKFNKYDELIVTMDTILPPSSQLPIKTPGTYKYTGSDFVISINNYQYAAEMMLDTLRLSHNPDTGGPLLKFIRAGE